MNVVTGRVISSLISATFNDESTPPESSTPNGTSDTMRRAIDCLSRRVSSCDGSGSLRSCSDRQPRIDRAGSPTTAVRGRAARGSRSSRGGPAGILKMPRNIVSGAGATMNVR